MTELNYLSPRSPDYLACTEFQKRLSKVHLFYLKQTCNANAVVGSVYIILCSACTCLLLSFVLVIVRFTSKEQRYDFPRFDHRIFSFLKSHIIGLVESRSGTIVLYISIYFILVSLVELILPLKNFTITTVFIYEHLTQDLIYLIQYQFVLGMCISIAICAYFFIKIYSIFDYFF